MAACDRLGGTLDDAPIVTPANSSAGPAFAAGYEALCADVGVRLASPCPDFDKAFVDSTVGTVLGVRFFTETLTWQLSKTKFMSITDDISVPLLDGPLSFKEAQSLTGKFNDVCQMCLFLRAFRFLLNKFVASFQGSTTTQILAPPPVLRDLRVFAAAIITACSSLPIPARPLPLPLTAVVYTSDAAGARSLGCGAAVYPTEVSAMVPLPSGSTSMAPLSSALASPGPLPSSSTRLTLLVAPLVAKPPPLRYLPCSYLS